MRIPLDYYRILGLPIQATADQLHQAHRDRALQLPRREFSEMAIAARRQLLDEAYAVLSDPQERQTYDAGFLAKGYDLGSPVLPHQVAEEEDGASSLSESATDPYSPSIEIQDSQLIGALLILLELGEYELVLRQTQPFLSSGNLSLNSGRFGQPDIVRSDMVLTAAFAYLELGREQWQQGQYENAAASLEAGQSLLLREGLFAGVRGEMQSDLFKLRPYRILELLALPESSVAERRQGISLLQDMLHDRGGIDGNGDDQSGLNVDDFLRFLQQLRGYLTAAEQQSLFEAEARRPSAVATYLAVYALLARGFAYRQPALVRRAKVMLLRLGSRQDVHLEQAVCALLLGQTEEASRALELSQEYESLSYIREHSQGSPDLLPGLCLYSERWLQNEVFPHFRDLSRQQASLKEYFADSQVQSYLEELPNDSEAEEQWSGVRSEPMPADSGFARQRNGTPLNGLQGRSARVSAAAAGSGGTATVTMDPATVALDDPGVMPTAERISQLSPEGRLNGGGDRAFRTASPTPSKTGSNNRPAAPAPAHSEGRRTLRLDRLVFLIAALSVLGLMLWILGSWIARAFSGGPTLTGEQLAIGIVEPPIAIPDASSATPAPDPNAPLNNDTARTVIETWLQAKTQAMGSTHDTTQLTQILTGSILAARQGAAEEAKQSGNYEVLEHPRIEVESVQADPSDPNQTEVEAIVTERSTRHEDGQAVGEPNQEDLRIRYALVRQDGQWRIQDITTLGSAPPFEGTADAVAPITDAASPETDGTATPGNLPEAAETPAAEAEPSPDRRP